MGSAISNALVSTSLRAAAETYARLLEQELQDNLVAVILFGSVARGDATSGSDIDLLVICETLPAGRFARLRVLERAVGDGRLRHSGGVSSATV